MKVTIRTLQQKTFEVDAEPQHTVLNLKQKVGSVQGEPAEHLKLFYAGRTLSDDQRSIESLNLKENSYLPRTGDFEPAKAKFNTSATATTSASIPPLPIFPRSDLAASAPPKNPVPSTSFSAPSHTPTPKPSVEPQSSAFDSNKWMSGSSMFGGSAPGDSVKNLVDMGFERDQVMKALKASFGNTERAVEYLTTGIPEDLGESPSTSSSTSAFRPFGMSGNAFSSGSFPSAGPGPSAFGPFDPPSSFIRPRPTEMVGHIEEVDPDQVEEPSKLVDSEPTPPSPPTVPKEIVDPSEPIKSATEPTQSVPATLPDELLSVASSTQPAAPTPPSIALPPSPTLVPSPTVPPSPTLSPSPIAPPSPTPSPPPLPVAHTLPSVSAPSPSVISPPTPSTSSSTFAPSQPDFSALSALAGFGGGFGGENITLESLRDDPTVRQIRELAGQNPDLIRPLFEHLVQSKPQVMGLLASNPEAFVRLLLPEANNPHEEPTTHAISVTDEEKEAIERLVSLGFPQTMVIQAYFAFDKNEEAAANYLIENCDDD